MKMETDALEVSVSESNTMTTVTNTSSANRTDINFEDLIKATNVSITTQRVVKEEVNNDVEKSSQETTTTTSKTLHFTKIAPKPTTGTSIKGSNTGQVVLIQGPSGTPLPIRISGASTSAVGKQAPVTIQVLKMPDGSLVQIKNNKALNLTNLSNVTQVNIGAKKDSPMTVSSIKTTNGTTIPLTSHTKVTLTTNNGTPVLKSLTFSEAQKAGLLRAKSNELNAKTLPKILPAPSPVVSTSSTLTTTAGIKQKILLPDKREVIIKSETESGTKQILVPQHLLKLSPNTAGPIQAIQIPGKPGLQYVRVLGTTGSTTSSNTLSTVKPKDGSPTKMTVVTSQMVGGQRIIMNKPKQSLTFTSSKETSAATTLSVKPNPIRMTTVPTLRKINDQGTTAKAATVIKKEEDDTSIPPKTATLKISQINQMAVKKLNTSNPSNNSNSTAKPQFLVVPQELFRQMQSNEKEISVPKSGASERKLFSVLKPSSDISLEEPTPINRKRTPSPDCLRRKHCNCTKSQCLKLYCDCFANGEFCQDCNCKECFNNLEYEDERQKAIKICLERNPNAFKPKITKARDQSDLRLHNKGCNCKRSGCLKNYCECYEAKIACSSNCKCFGCRNVEDRSEIDPIDVAKIAQNFGRGVATKRPYDEISERPSTSTAISIQPTNKQPYNFITQDVVDATIQCMIAQADECKKSGIMQKNTEKMILEELGRCLVEIIDFSIRNMDN